MPTLIKSSEIKDLIIKLNIEHDSWASDLYIPKTPQTTEIIENYEFPSNVTIFQNTSGEGTPGIWYEIAFAY